MRILIKKVLRIISVLAFISIVIYSCDSKQQEISRSGKQNSVLLTQLSEINSNFALTHPCTKAPSSRTIVVAADIKGAITGGKWGAEHGGLIGTACGSPLAGAIITGMIGGLVFGGLESYLASSVESAQVLPFNYDDMIQIYHTYVGSFATEEQPGIEADVDYEQVILDNSEIAQEEPTLDGIFIPGEALEAISLDYNALRVGQLHNIMLAGLNQRIPVLVDSVVTERSLEEELIQSRLFRNKVLEVCRTFDINQVFSESDEETLPDEVMSLYWNIFESNVSSCTDIVTLINNYSSAIMNSNELSDIEKEWIQMGLAVSIYSYNYWDQSGVLTDN